MGASGKVMRDTKTLSYKLSQLRSLLYCFSINRSFAGIVFSHCYLNGQLSLLAGKLGAVVWLARSSHMLLPPSSLCKRLTHAAGEARGEDRNRILLPLAFQDERRNIVLRTF